MALPLAWPGVLAGAVTAFAAGLGEFGAVITFASNVEGQTQTLPLAIYSALQVPGGEEMALRLAAISMTAAVDRAGRGGVAAALGAPEARSVSLKLKEVVVRRGAFRLAADFEVPASGRHGGVRAIGRRQVDAAPGALPACTASKRAASGFNGRVLEDAACAEARRRTRPRHRSRLPGCAPVPAPHGDAAISSMPSGGVPPRAMRRSLIEIARRLEIEDLLDAAGAQSVGRRKQPGRAGARHRLGAGAAAAG